jgi:hypothetical protein
MKPTDYHFLLERAAASEYGIRVKLNQRYGEWAYRRMKRRLYYVRDRARARGDRSFDHLSVCQRWGEAEDGRPRLELWIIRRDRLRGAEPEDDGLEALHEMLCQEELPGKIHARGPNIPR